MPTQLRTNIQAMTKRTWVRGSFIRDPSLVFYLPLYTGKLVSKDRIGHVCTNYGSVPAYKGRWFDGGDDYISIPNTTPVDITARPLTLLSWFNVAPAATAGYTICKNLDAAANNQYGYHYDALGHFACYLEGVAYTASAGGTISTGKWYLGGYTWDVAGAVTAFVNGQASGTPGSYTGTLTSRANLAIGRRAIGAYFQGIIGEVWIYNRALSPREVMYNFLATKWFYR